MRAPRRQRLIGFLLLCSAALLPGCLQPVVLPRIDLGGAAPDPHGTYSTVKLGDGSTLKLGVETGGKDDRPWIALVGADGKPVWQRSYGRIGQGGHAAFVAGARLADASLLGVAADRTITTLVMVAFEPDGRVRWGQELDLPGPAAGMASVTAAGSGAVVSVPLSGGGGTAGTLVVRIDAKGSVVEVQPSGRTLSGAPRDLRGELARTER